MPKCDTLDAGSQAVARLKPKEPSIRHPLSLLLVIGVIALAIPATAAAQQAPTPAERMLALINQARVAQGLNPVAVSAELTAAALAHARDMVAHGYMEHEGRDGSTPHKRAVRHGYTAPLGSPWIVVDVITARATPEAGLNWLLSDALHRGVVLRKVWREVGIGYVEGGPTGHLWNISFGCRPNVLPVVTETTAEGGITLRLTNEDCAPGGGSAEQMGQATQVMLSDRADFDGAVWQPFVSTRTVSPTTGSVFVKLRDSRGRETSTVAGTGVSTLSATTVVEPVAVPAIKPAAAVEGLPSTTTSPTASGGSAPNGGSPAGLFSPSPSILPR